MGEAAGWLAPQSVAVLPGVGPAMAKRLSAAGFVRLGQLAALDARAALARFGADGPALVARARGEDDRPVNPARETKSISAETTFDTDIRDATELERLLWPLAERVSRRAKAEGVAGHTVVLKLKTADFRIRTRNVTLADPTLLAARIYEAARPLLRREATGTAFRLIGVGISGLTAASAAQETETLDVTAATQAKAELAVDRIRDKFGRAAVARGIGFGLDDESE